LFAEEEKGVVELLLRDMEFTRAYAATYLQQMRNLLQGRA
jgi:hypothetical protein